MILPIPIRKINDILKCTLINFNSGYNLTNTLESVKYDMNDTTLFNKYETQIES